ncbi:LacI family DNA-binding transcriptional regulator [Paracandidimonas soli]|uniref:LacI family DNA-binding transcriptional regulator n=1 Tax=Paracandidimonas soli TaxID=1917182 RepID=UPI00333EC229
MSSRKNTDGQPSTSRKTGGGGPSNPETPPVKRSSRATGSVTLDDVARAAGVAPSTVSRVVNKPGLVSSKTTAHVQAVIDALGYVPNLLAGGLASRRTRLIAAVVPTVSNVMFAQMVQSLGDTLSHAGYEMLLGLSGYDQQREQHVVDAILSRRPDGIFLTGAQHTPHTIRRLREARIPVVETWDLRDDPIDMLVGFSHEQAGQAIADYLLSRGYRKFGAISGNDIRAQTRLQSLELRLRENGLSLLDTQTSLPGSTLAMGRMHLANLLDAAHGLDAVVCSSDSLAYGAIIEAQSRGLRVPQDIAVMGFGDYEFASLHTPSISTVHIDGPSMGRLAGDFLLQRIHANESGASSQVTDIGFQIISRQSA